MNVPTPPVTRVLETALYVADLERSRDFYVRVFGFQPVLEDHRMVALAVPGRQVLLLFRLDASREPSQSPAGLIPAHDGHGPQHLCFRIGHADVTGWQEHLAAVGVALEARLDWPKGPTSLYFRDPDGHSLEVGTAGLWPNDPEGDA